MCVYGKGTSTDHKVLVPIINTVLIPYIQVILPIQFLCTEDLCVRNKLKYVPGTLYIGTWYRITFSMFYRYRILAVQQDRRQVGTATTAAG
jgi:hypothetical protein